MKIEKLERLAFEKSTACVSISMNTHRTHPGNTQDAFELKKLCKEAEEKLISDFGKRPVASILEKLELLPSEIDVNYNLDSLHIFLSENTYEIIKSPWPTLQNTVHIEESFEIKPLIKLLNRTEDYLILLLTKSGVNLLHAVNDIFVEEIVNDDFHFNKDLHYLSHNDKYSDSKKLDEILGNFLNQVDKAVLKVHHETAMNCVVICPENNYLRLLQVADMPAIYYGYTHIDYKNTTDPAIVAAAWQIVKAIQKQHRADAIQEMQEAVGQNKVLTGLSEIFRAAKEGRGDLLIVHEDFHQAVKMTGEFSFDLVDDNKQADIIHDISSEIAWEVISKKGRAIFTNQEEIKALGDIVLKIRY